MSYPFDQAEGTPADRPTVLVACRAGGDSDVVVQYGSGELWYRRPDASAGGQDGWRPMAAPPGNVALGVAGGWAAAQGAAVVALGSADQRVWVTTGRPERPDWQDLGRPVESGAYSVAAVELPGASVASRLVALVNWHEELWLRVDPLDGSVPDPAAWESIPLPPDTVAVRAGVLVAGEGPEPPVGHVVVLLWERSTGTGRLGVVVREDGSWRWREPPAPPRFVDPFLGVLVAGAVAGTDGVVGCAAVGGVDHGQGRPADVLLLHGARASWTWSVLGQPSADDTGLPQAVVPVGAGDDGAAVPAVLVSAGAEDAARLWAAFPDGTWALVGSPAPELPVGSVSGLRGGLAAGPLAVVAGTRHRLWTVRTPSTGAVWTELAPLPSTVADVVGGLDEWFDDDAPDPGFHLVTVGTDGVVRSRRWDGTAWTWLVHPSPAPGVAARSGLGAVRTPDPDPTAHVVVTGSDDGIWHRIRAGATWSWTAHGSPGNAPVRATAPPVLLPADPWPHLVAWGRDGQVWVRSHAGEGWRWTPRDAPPGATIFGLVGAVAGAPPGGGSEGLVVFVITHDGAVWGNWASGTRTTWTPLGPPGPALPAAAGVGVVPVLASPEGPMRVRVLVLDGAQRHLRAVTWPPGGPGSPAPVWEEIAPPPGVGVAGSFGAVRDPEDPTRAIAFLEGSDRHLWALLLGGATAPAWEDRGLLPGPGRVRGRAVLAGMVDRFPSWRVYPLAPVCGGGRLVVRWPG